MAIPIRYGADPVRLDRVLTTGTITSSRPGTIAIPESVARVMGHAQLAPGEGA